MLPSYANTHTESSGTGLQTTRLREDARRIIHEAVGGDDDTVVLFAGSGTTGAVVEADRRAGAADPVGARGPLPPHRAHPGRRSGRSCSSVPTSTTPTRSRGASRSPTSSPSRRTPTATSTSTRLRAALLEYADRPLRIGSFSAASNVTGIVSNTVAIAEILHEHGALSFWDFAAAAPYIDIEMYPARDEHPLACKDALFLSPHKFIGGPVDARRARRPARAVRQPGARRAGRRHGRLRQRLRPRLPAGAGAPRGGRHPGDHRVDPGGAGLPAQAGGRCRDDPARRGAVPLPRGGDVERRSRRSRSSATSTPTGSRSCRSSYVLRRVATCTTTSWSPCSTTCSASSRAAAARAPVPTATGCSASTSSAATSSSARSPAAARASSPAGCG